MNTNTAILFALLIVLVYSICRDLIDAGLHAWYCRKAQYDCGLCRYWTCPAHYCRHRKEKLGFIEHRCSTCKVADDCYAAFSGVVYPCPYYEECNTDPLQDDVAGDVERNT